MDAGECAGLTPRERDVLRLLAEGKTNRDIALDLCISEQTVRNHTTALYAHLNIDVWSSNPRVVAAVMFVREQGAEG